MVGGGGGGERTREGNTDTRNFNLRSCDRLHLVLFMWSHLTV